MNKEDMIYKTVNDYRLKINRRLSMHNMPGAIREAEYLKEYLVRTMTRQNTSAPVNDTFRRTLETAYICGLDTVGEAIANWQLHALQCCTYKQAAVEEADLVAAVKDYANNVLVTDILTREECQKLDDDMNEAMGNG